MTQLSLPFLFATPPKKKYDFFVISECLKRATVNTSQGENNNPAVMRWKNAIDEVRPLQASEMGLALPATGRALRRRA